MHAISLCKNDWLFLFSILGMIGENFKDSVQKKTMKFNMKKERTYTIKFHPQYKQFQKKMVEKSQTLLSLKVNVYK